MTAGSRGLGSGGTGFGGSGGFGRSTTFGGSGLASWVPDSAGFGSVVWDCRYASIEACRPNVISGNRGFCNHNPGYEAPVEPRRKRQKRRAHH